VTANDVRKQVIANRLRCQTGLEMAQPGERISPCGISVRMADHLRRCQPVLSL